jgi:hypothetical protein
VLDGPRPGFEDIERDQVWLALRRQLYDAATGTPFDPRHISELDLEGRHVWLMKRRSWAAAFFAGDPRVDVGGRP